MSATPPQVVQLTCPSCRTPLRAQIFTLVDVSRQPELKNYLLSGQLNMVVCPNCGNVSMIAAPLIYHDPAKQIFLVHFPQQLNARPDEQERFIGDATSLLMRNLPADAPKGYLLAPRRFLTMNSLIETVLEADGISREMIEAQRKRVDLISQLAEAYEQGEEQLTTLVAQHRDELDYQFFATLTAFAEASAQGNDQSSQLLLQLRDKLVELTGFNGDDTTDQDLPLEEVLNRLIEVSDEELEQVIIELRPLIDYSFFEALTEQIENAETSGDQTTVDQLTARRARILELVEQIDKQAQEMFDSGTQLLREVLAAADPTEALRSRSADVNEAFLLVVEANEAAAQRAGNGEMAALLGDIRKLAVEIIQESLPPEDRLINQLLQAETPQAATQLLRQNMGMITTAFVKRINELADELEHDGHEVLGERLRQLGREAGAMLF